MIITTVILSVVAMVGIIIQSRMKGKESMERMNRERFIVSDPNDEMNDHIYNK